MNGAQALFKALVDAGITTCFANPGTSEMQLVYEIGMADKVRPVLCLQEDVVTGAADGYARMTGAPGLQAPACWQRLRMASPCAICSRA
jgi:acetolactate synthase-1/2/3 large subunit